MESNWQNCAVKPDTSIENLIKILDEIGLQILVVVDPKNHVLGVVSDGDVRRWLLRWGHLEGAARDIMNSRPVLVSSDLSLSKVEAIMSSKGLDQIPIVDSVDGTFVGLHSRRSLAREYSTKACLVLMAGGEGVRLRPETLSKPKPLLEVKGRPILEHLIIKARDEGICDIFICVNYLGSLIKDYFGDGSRFGVSINYVDEESKMGTGGALKLISVDALSRYKYCLVLNGDVLTEVRFEDVLRFHAEQKADCTVCAVSHEWRSEFGTIEKIGNDLLQIVEKPLHKSLINAGLYVINIENLRSLQLSGYFDMTDLVTTYVERGSAVKVYAMREKWVDIGRPSDLSQVRDASAEDVRGLCY